MIKRFNFLFFILFLLTLKFAAAQAPQGINYQAIARDASGSILADKKISIRISITDSNTGDTLYIETHTDTTNHFGLFTLTIGNGIPEKGSFFSINWGTVSPWMQVDMDPN